VRLSDVLDVVYRRYRSLLVMPDKARAEQRADALSLINKAWIDSLLAANPETAGLTWDATEFRHPHSPHFFKVFMHVERNEPCDLATATSFVADIASLVARERKEDELIAAAAARGYVATRQDIQAVMGAYLAQNLPIAQGLGLLHTHLMHN
jgi:hypothetical protein